MKDKLFSLSQVVGDKYSYHAKLEKMQELSCSIEFKPTIETKSEQFSQLEILQEQLNSEEKFLEELGPNFDCIEIEETRLSNTTLLLKKKSENLKKKSVNAVQDWLSYVKAHEKYADNYNEIFNSLESKEKEINSLFDLSLNKENIDLCLLKLQVSHALSVSLNYKSFNYLNTFCNSIFCLNLQAYLCVNAIKCY